MREIGWLRYWVAGTFYVPIAPAPLNRVKAGWASRNYIYESETPVKMNHLIFVVAAATALVSLSSAQAQSVTLSVKGTVSPGACTPTLTNGGVLDWGIIPANTLSNDAPTHLLPKPIDLSIACSAATSIAIRAVDNSAATRVPDIALTPGGGAVPAPSVSIYGLGTAEGKNIGAYTVGLPLGATADGATVSAMSNNNGGGWNFIVNNNATLYTTALYSWAAPGSTRNPGAYKNISTRLTITPTLDKGLPLTSAITLNGSMSIELDYLS